MSHFRTFWRRHTGKLIIELTFSVLSPQISKKRFQKGPLAPIQYGIRKFTSQFVN